MTRRQYISSRKLNILELGRTFGNISEACRRLGVNRQQYYEIKETDGIEELIANQKFCVICRVNVERLTQQHILLCPSCGTEIGEMHNFVAILAKIL